MYVIEQAHCSQLLVVSRVLKDLLLQTSFVAYSSVQGFYPVTNE